MGKRGRLKIAWLRPCRFESCSGHHPHSRMALAVWLARSVQLIQYACPDVIGREQILERVPIEQGRSLVVLVRSFDFDPIDFLRHIEDLANSKGLFDIPLENLCPQGVHDSVASVDTERERIHRIRRIATCVSEKFEGSGWFHENAKHTRRGMRDSSMNREGVKASDLSCTSTFGVACSQQASDGQQILCRYAVEGDAKTRIIISPRGPAQQPGMQRGHRPCDSPTRPKPTIGGKSKLDPDPGSRRDAFSSRYAQAAETDVRAAAERRDRFSIQGFDA